MSTTTISLVLSLALATPAAGEPGATDLAAARAEAEAARKAAPGAATWGREAEACERLADYACAREARTQERALTRDGSAERAAVDAELAALVDLSRGTVADEPASTRRAENDRAREPVAAIKPTPDVDREPARKPAPAQPIVKRWYFWVTILAIAASGVAITAIAVKAADDEQKTSPGAARVRLDQGFGLRF